MEVNAVVPPRGTLKRLNANIPCWVCSLKARETLEPFVSWWFASCQLPGPTPAKEGRWQPSLHGDFLFCEGGGECKMFWKFNAALVGSVLAKVLVLRG